MSGRPPSGAARPASSSGRPSSSHGRPASSSGRPQSGAGHRPPSATQQQTRPGSRPNSSGRNVSIDEGRPSSALVSSPSGSRRPYSAATLEIGKRAAEYATFVSENQASVQFLQDANRDIEHLCEYGELFPSNMIEEFADSSRNIIMKIRLNDDAPTDSKHNKQQFRKLLDISYAANVKNGDREDNELAVTKMAEGTLSNKFQRQPLAPALAGVVQRRSVSVEPLPNIYQQKMRNKLNKVPADTTDASNVNFISGSIQMPMNPHRKMKQKQITVVTGKVNYGDLLKEQHKMKLITDEKSIKYEKIMDDFNTSMTKANRRISLMLKPNQKLLPIEQYL